MTPVPEFSRPVRIDTLGSTPRQMSLGANEAERAALAKRFGVVEIERLSAEAAVTRSVDQVVASGTLSAKVTQSCVATREPVEETVDEEFRIEFRPQPSATSEEDEIELGEGELDVVFYDGGSIDIGEAVAETLSLSLESYPRAPNADEVLKEAGVKGEEEAGPFGALAALKDKLGR
ncbi:MAG TPA: DUF177 domain-containing protein [Allosphingosinicella sp.]|nr:DUF177 domain-containing protein [Allosphingosinicella sp.]